MPNFRRQLSSAFCRTCVSTQVRYRRAVTRPFVRLFVNNWLVSATPPTGFGQSFWNFTDVLAMACRCAYCLFIILRFFFLQLFPLCYLSQILPKTLIVSGCLVSATPTVFGQSFWNFTDVLAMVCRYAYCLLIILRFFSNFFRFVNLVSFYLKPL